ncbi:MAG: hypothetical protein KJ770_04760 [Actinobacteria bacterium]|nr:hypothetical protein [Actinomycetota bacterium]MCG2789859.1 hypothetical protein [Actinomycetes bacterium]
MKAINEYKDEERIVTLEDSFCASGNSAFPVKRSDFFEPEDVYTISGIKGSDMEGYFCLITDNIRLWNFGYNNKSINAIPVQHYSDPSSLFPLMGFHSNTFFSQTIEMRKSQPKIIDYEVDKDIDLEMNPKESYKIKVMIKDIKKGKLRVILD